MIREYGSPTLFLTLSCAEYDSIEISIYLRKMNNVSDINYPRAKLCTEDPISVSSRNSMTFLTQLSSKNKYLVLSFTISTRKSFKPVEHHTTICYG